jgi:hypothetical protein
VRRRGVGERAIAVFGYVSSFTIAVHIDVGPNSFFGPGVVLRNQPTDFLPGAHPNACFLVRRRPLISRIAAGATR